MPKKLNRKQRRAQSSPQATEAKTALALIEVKPLTKNQGIAFDAHDDGKHLFLYGYAGTGKRILNTEKVLTDSGWKQVGEVTATDKLVAPDGSYTDILGIFPQDTGSIYDVKFEDGCSLKVDGEHLWSVRNIKTGYKNKSEFVVKTTNDLLKTPAKWSIPLLTGAAPGVKWNGVDPYIIGLLLGDGTMMGQHPTVYTPEPEIVSYLESLGWKKYQYSKKSVWMVQATNAESKFGIDVLDAKTGKEKYVPQSLLDADPEARLALLQGLMDTDGHVQKDGSCSFSTVSQHLANAVQYIVRSLGGKSKIRRKFIKGGFGGDHDVLFVSVLHANKFNPFRIERKRSRVKEMKGKYRRIVSITQVEDGPATCFKVSHPSSLFVCQDFIVTHNTFMAMALGLEEVLEEFTYEKVIIYRSTVPTRDMGFLPGTEKEKTAVYEVPYVRNATKLFGRSDAYQKLKNQGKIEFESTAHIRGITWEDSFVIIDEAQNMNAMELNSLMTRVGPNCKLVICGDIRQADLERRKEKTGLRDMMKVLKSMKSFATIEFQIEDIVRDPFVKEYIIARTQLEDSGEIDCLDS